MIPEKTLAVEDPSPLGEKNDEGGRPAGDPQVGTEESSLSIHQYFSSSFPDYCAKNCPSKYSAKTALPAAETPLWIFTDGSCLKNPGPGGWAFFVRWSNIYGESCHGELWGSEGNTTNNRMEMLAVIRALEWVQSQGLRSSMTITSDSQYVLKGITQWITGWMRNGWKTSAKKPVENQDLWQTLWNLTYGRDAPQGGISWQWVRGHNGHAENERVDQLARAAASIA